MRAEIVSVGTELLMGEVTNTSARYLAEQMRLLGIDVYYQVTVGDNHGRLSETLKQALNRAELVFTTGGLGPTTDDITVEVIAEALGLPLVLDQGWLSYLEEIMVKYNLKLTENNKKQAYLPEGAVALANPKGTAPGVFLEKGNKTVVALPGPPYELQTVFETGVLPKLKDKVGGNSLFAKVLRTAGIGEASLENKIRDIIDKQTNPTIALYAKMGEVHIRLAAKAGGKAEAEKIIKPVQEEILLRLARHVYGYDSDSLESCAGKLLAAQGITIACGESCSGGLLGSRLTNVPGSSAYFLGSIVAYDNRLKEKLLGVPTWIIEKYGAVSAETAAFMAQGVLEAAGADVALATTGIAGPGGGTEEKPVGTVYLGLAAKPKLSLSVNRLGSSYRVPDHEAGERLNKQYDIHAFHCLLIGSREEIKYRTTQAALFYLWDCLQKAST
jgi:nicotinamide-nucleotide amidase